MTPVALSSYQLMFITFKKWSGPPFGENQVTKCTTSTCPMCEKSNCAHLLQVFVTVDELPLMWVLEFVGLHVLPQGLNDDGSGLGVDTQHTGQSGVQLELRGLCGTQKDEKVSEFMKKCFKITR